MGLRMAFFDENDDLIPSPPVSPRLARSSSTSNIATGSQQAQQAHRLHEPSSPSDSETIELDEDTHSSQDPGRSLRATNPSTRQERRQYTFQQSFPAARPPRYRSDSNRYPLSGPAAQGPASIRARNRNTAGHFFPDAAYQALIRAAQPPAGDLQPPNNDSDAREDGPNQSRSWMQSSNNGDQTTQQARPRTSGTQRPLLNPGSLDFDYDQAFLTAQLHPRTDNEMRAQASEREQREGAEEEDESSGEASDQYEQDWMH